MATSPRVCFVGPMLGRNPGWVTTQGELLADHFAEDGWVVRETSRQPSRPVRLLDTLWCLLRWRRDVNLIVLSVFSGPAFVMADVTSAVARLLGLPTIFWLHGGNLPEFALSHPSWVRRVLLRASLIVSPSMFLASGVDWEVDDIRLIPNLLEIDRVPFRQRDEMRPRLLWMRTFHPIYNPAMAVKALERLRRSRTSARLTMAGQEKGLTDAVRAQASSSGVADAVDFVGFLDPDDKAAVFDAHDIYLHTNHVDNTPVSVLEAAAAGLAIVATKVGGIPYMLEHEHSALLVPDDDHDAMATAIERLLDEPELAELLRRNARRLAELSTWPEVRAKWVQAFNEALGTS